MEAASSIGCYQLIQWPLLLKPADNRRVIEDTYDQWLLAAPENGIIMGGYHIAYITIS